MLRRDTGFALSSLSRFEKPLARAFIVAGFFFFTLAWFSGPPA
jgi:hypothetical protein